jgi:hypothetical protein
LAWRRDTGAVLRTFIAVQRVTMIMVIIQVTITMVGGRAPPGWGIRAVQVTGAECILSLCDYRGLLPHVGYAAHVPCADVVVER